METVTVPILESDLQKLEEIAYMMNKGLVHGCAPIIIKKSHSAGCALREGIDILHKAWVTK